MLSLSCAPLPAFAPAAPRAHHTGPLSHTIPSNRPAGPHGGTGSDASTSPPRTARRAAPPREATRFSTDEIQSTPDFPTARSHLFEDCFHVSRLSLSQLLSSEDPMSSYRKCKDLKSQYFGSQLDIIRKAVSNV